MIVIENICDRLKHLRKFELKLNQEEFGSRINITQNSITRFESKRISPSDRTISDICREYNVNEDWLRNGHGEIFIKTSTDELEALAIKYKLDTMSKNIVEAFINLSYDDKKVLASFIDSIKSITSLTTNEVMYNVEFGEQLSFNFNKLSEDSKEDVIQYTNTLLLNEQQDKNNRYNLKKSEDNISEENNTREQA